MLSAFYLYLRYIAISFRSQMQYRASFVMQSVGHFLITGIEFLGIWALFDRGEAVGLRPVYERLRSEFEVDPDVLERDLLELVADLAERGIIEILDPER